MTIVLAAVAVLLVVVLVASWIRASELLAAKDDLAKAQQAITLAVKSRDDALAQARSLTTEITLTRDGAAADAKRHDAVEGNLTAALAHANARLDTLQSPADALRDLGRKS